MAIPVPAAVEADDAWINEIDFDPEGAWLRMGTRNLGERPWLVVDGKRKAELELKQKLLNGSFDEVFAADAEADGPSTEVLALVSDALSTLEVPPDQVSRDSQRDGAVHPLDQAGRMIQEDLCLLRPQGDGTWVLAAASLCFPSRWRLATKIGRGLNAVHGPVPGYDPSLVSRVDSLMTRLASRASATAHTKPSSVVWRRNWFIHPDPSLFQPDRPSSEPIITSDRCLDELYLRSERQTLRALPASGWVLFAIRTQQATLRTVVAADERRAAFVEHVRHAPSDLLNHRGVDADQRGELLVALLSLDGQRRPTQQE